MNLAKVTILKNFR